MLLGSKIRLDLTSDFSIQDLLIGHRKRIICIATVNLKESIKNFQTQKSKRVFSKLKNRKIKKFQTPKISRISQFFSSTLPERSEPRRLST